MTRLNKAEKMARDRAELEKFRIQLRKFRDKWETVIAAQAYKTLTMPPKRGAKRSIYLLLDGDPLMRKFVAAFEKMDKRVDKFLADHSNVARRDLDVDTWLPNWASKCIGVRVKSYVATSQREVSRDQAAAFLAKIDRDDMLPTGSRVFCMRSRTGRRYKLEVSRLEGILELPLRAWAVVISQKKLGEGDAPEKPVEGKRRTSDKIWRKSRGHKFLGESKNRRSRLYALAKGHAKIRKAR